MTYRGMRMAISLGGLALLAIVLFGWLVKAGSNPAFCATCHEDRAEVRAWERSPHREVACSACHNKPGLTGMVLAQARLLTFMFKHVSGLYGEPKSGGRPGVTIQSGTCEACHTPHRKVTPSKGVLIDHKRHKEKGVACIECHNRVSHPGIKGYPDFMKMKECFRCHGFEKTAKAPGKCESCHTKIFDLMPVSHKTKSWKTQRHPVEASKDMRYCYSCHPRGFCIDCHRLPMPHPRDWVRTGKLHARTGLASPKICHRCHTAENFCSSCHHKGYQPKRGPWIAQHFKIVMAKGVYPCFRCHEVTYCSFCHVRGVARSPLEP